MSQRGFTLLEMMLVLLLIGVSASMVLLAFPSARTQEATQILARFQAQLDFVRERGQQTGQLFGIIIHPERWQFMRLQPADDSAPAAADDRWGQRAVAAAAGRTRHHGGNPPAGQADAALSRRPGVDAGRAARRAYFSRR
ncbi:type II secretion system minor pseudopilin GspH [Klebsiella pneumoniae]